MNKYVSKLDLKIPENLSHLIVNCLCGETESQTLHEDERELLSTLAKSLIENKLRINYNQLNELLLLLNQDTIGEGFFKFFFEKDQISFRELRQGIINFCGLAMLCFGNLKYAYKTLANKTSEEIKQELIPYSRNRSELITEFANRPEKMLEISKILKTRSWLAGELSAGRIKGEFRILRKEIEKCERGQSIFKKEELEEFGGKLLQIEADEKEVQEIARKNTDIYLTWDYMDLYFATSMRASWEFEETYDFIEEVFSDKRLRDLKLRYFDPTSSKCGNRVDKGIIEGLMLKRASCTVYMVQESDTLGKDSELAATLAQKKPVIAYVPKHNLEKYSETIFAYPLEFFKKRVLILQAEEIFDDPACKELLSAHKDFKSLVQKYLDEINDYYKKQPLRMWTEKESIIKNKEDFKEFCHVLAIAECVRFDNRAKMLRDIHPLALQVDLESGVSNGVLVVRSSKECADLLYRILTNKLDFAIKHVEYNDEIRKRKEGYTLLIEDISKSPFRVITDQRQITNSFWNLFFRTQYDLNREGDQYKSGNQVDKRKPQKRKHGTNLGGK